MEHGLGVLPVPNSPKAICAHQFFLKVAKSEMSFALMPSSN
jgi:hypothetical protein